MGKTESDSMEEAYLDRNQLVQAMAKMAVKLGYNAGIKHDPEWPIIYIELPTGQVSWHIPRKELIVELPEYSGVWDNHDLDEKRKRIEEYCNKTDDVRQRTPAKVKRR
jgi:hypothetical protein